MKVVCAEMLRFKPMYVESKFASVSTRGNGHLFAPAAFTAELKCALACDGRAEKVVERDAQVAAASSCQVFGKIVEQVKREHVSSLLREQPELLHAAAALVHRHPVAATGSALQRKRRRRQVARLKASVGWPRSQALASCNGGGGGGGGGCGGGSGGGGGGFGGGSS
eukprot:6211244-Pleurochrysis_carterae.AAC.1